MKRTERKYLVCSSYGGFCTACVAWCGVMMLLCACLFVCKFASSCRHGMTRLRELATSKIRRPIHTHGQHHPFSKYQNASQIRQEGRCCRQRQKCWRGRASRSPSGSCMYIPPARAKKSAESCIDNNDDNIYEIELTHVRHRFWPILSSQNSSLSHLSARDASCH
jgi:hypothetical protein